MTFTFIYYALKQLPLVIVSLVLNLSPIAIAVLSYIILKEKLAKIDIIILLVSFIGVLVLIMGSNENTSTSNGE